RRLKAGPGRSSGYRMIDGTTLQTLRASGRVLWENTRYGATYVVDQPALNFVAAQAIPVLHLGQVEAINRVTAATSEIRWFVVELWCSRAVAAERISERQTGDLPERLAAYDQTERLPDALTDLRIATDTMTPQEASDQIRDLVMLDAAPSPDA